MSPELRTGIGAFLTLAPLLVLLVAAVSGVPV